MKYILKIKYLIAVLFILPIVNMPQKAYSQIVYEHLSNESIYEFIDEMANLNYIHINDVIKPYPKQQIYKYLSKIEADVNAGRIKLNKRQSEELSFYLQAYILEQPKSILSKKTGKKKVVGKLNPFGLFYKDEEIALGFQPIWGAEAASNKKGNYSGSYGGASFYGYVGNQIGIYGNVRDQNVSTQLISPDYLTRRPSAPYKKFGESIDYSEARGGIVYSFKWGHIGFVKDHIQWGTGYNGTNILRGTIPSFAQIKLNIKPTNWFEFNYYHGSLTSNVVDSLHSYKTNNTYRAVFYSKYIAANMFTFYPLKHLNISIGNSIIYTNENGGGPKLTYLIPFLFYKSADLTVSSNESGGYTSNNNQMFFSISSRNIKHLHLYFSLFADDISVRYFFNSDLYNSFAYKLGFRLSNFKLQNVSLTMEYTRTNPYVYQHHAQTQDYTTNEYNMGHYLGGNSQELYVSLRCTPIRGLAFQLSYTFAQKGDDYDINSPIESIHSDPILKNIIWEKQNILFRVNYEILSNTHLYGLFSYQNISGNQEKIQKFTPEFYWGKTFTVSGGLNIGF